MPPRPNDPVTAAIGSSFANQPRKRASTVAGSNIVCYDVMLKEGATAPDFEASLDDGTSFRLSTALKTAPVVLYFYPKDFTGGCTKQACSFRDRFEDITAAGAQLFGVSTDSEERHTRFRDEYNLPFSLIADPEKRIVDAYDARGPFGLGYARVTYVIDQTSTVRKTIRHDIRVDRHVPDVLEALAELSKT